MLSRNRNFLLGIHGGSLWMVLGLCISHLHVSSSKVSSKVNSVTYPVSLTPAALSLSPQITLEDPKPGTRVLPVCS